MAEAVLIAGGSGGIGGAFCRRLASVGFHPFIGYASGGDAAMALAAEIGGTALALDLTDEISIAAAVGTLAASPFDLAGVVLAASPPPCVAPVFRQPEGELDLQWEVNVRGTVRLLDGCIRKLMRPRKKGWVLAVLSEAMGRDGTAAKEMGPYIVAKYGLLGLMKVVAAEYSWLDIQTIEPGYTETPMLNAFDRRFLDQRRAAMPGGRFSSPDEIAADAIARIRGI